MPTSTTEEHLNRIEMVLGDWYTYRVGPAPGEHTKALESLTALRATIAELERKLAEAADLMIDSTRTNRLASARIAELRAQITELQAAESTKPRR